MVDREMGPSLERVEATSGVGVSRGMLATTGLRLALVGLVAVVTGGNGIAGFTLLYGPPFHSNEDTGARALVRFDFDAIENETKAKITLTVANITGDSPQTEGGPPAWTDLYDIWNSLGSVGDATDGVITSLGFDLYGYTSESQVSDISIAPDDVQLNSFFDATLAPFGAFTLSFSTHHNNLQGGAPTNGVERDTLAFIEFMYDYGSGVDFNQLVEGFEEGFESGELETFARLKSIEGADESSDKLGGGLLPPSDPPNDPPPPAVPEPSSLAIWGLCLGALGLVIRRRMVAPAA